MWSCLRGSDLSRKALEGEHPLGATRTDKGPRGPPVTPRPPHPARPSRIAAAFTPVTARRYSTVPCPHTHTASGRHGCRRRRTLMRSRSTESAARAPHPAAFFHASTIERRRVVPLSAAPRAITVSARLPHGAAVGAERLSARVCAQPLRCAVRFAGSSAGHTETANVT